jgi:hypothetical protein
MTRRPRRNDYPVYIESGDKRVFACALDWPGWARSGRDEKSAVESLYAYAPRYAEALKRSRLGFEVPRDPSALVVVERLRGTATTDFGAPDSSPSADADAVTEPELKRFATLLRASWRAFDRAVQGAEGVELSKGPRGGGRDLEKIVDHVLGSEESYIGMIGGKAPKGDADGRAERVRRAVLDGLERAVREGVPPGPRGGKRWTPRYFVRRTVWHALDHAWEIEDRTRPG